MDMTLNMLYSVTWKLFVYVLQYGALKLRPAQTYPLVWSTSQKLNKSFSDEPTNIVWNKNPRDDVISGITFPSRYNVFVKVKSKSYYWIATKIELKVSHAI